METLKRELDSIQEYPVENANGRRKMNRVPRTRISGRVSTGGGKQRERKNIRTGCMYSGVRSQKYEFYFFMGAHGPARSKIFERKNLQKIITTHYDSV
jgi:hypothetical protein